CTIKEIMSHFTISEIAVRKHLRELENQDFIRMQSVKQDIGRPFHIYELTKKGHRTFPNQYEILPVELLEDLEDLQGKDAVDQLLEKRMKREEELLFSKSNDGTFDEKVQQLFAIQNERGYMFDYERTDDGDYEIINYNCPVMNIASSYKQVCTNEEKMFSNIFIESNVHSHCTITNGAHYCKWTISRPMNEN